MRKFNINSIFFAKLITRIYILVSIIILFFLSYNNKHILYIPILFVLIAFIFSALLISIRAPNLYIMLVSMVFFFYLIILNLNSSRTFASSVNPEKLVKLYGYVIKDQSRCESGNYYFRIKCASGELSDGTIISINGQTSIISKKNCDLLFLTPVKLEVEYVKELDLFKAKEIFVLSKDSLFNPKIKTIVFNIRENRNYLIKKIKAYLKCPLARMLILGRCDQEGFLFKNYALSLGCAHLLALSGMHLSIISLLFTSIFSKFVSKRKSKYLTLFVLSYFIYITGFIPSLIRSFIMYILSFLKIESELRNEIILLLSGVIQALIFPSTFISAGCLFSYGALSAIFLYSSVLKVHNKMSNMILTTVFAIIVTYPLSLSMGGSWCILSIILAPLLTTFITFEMIITLFVVLNSFVVDLFLYYNFRHPVSIIESIFQFILEIIKEVNFYLQKIIFYNERIIRIIFEYFNYVNKRLPEFLISYKGYLIFVFIVLTTCTVYLYSKGIKKIGVSHNELGLPI